MAASPAEPCTSCVTRSRRPRSPGSPSRRRRSSTALAGRAVVPLRDRGVHVDSSLVVIDRRTFDGRLLDAARTAGAELVAERASAVSVDAAASPIRTRSRVWRSAFVVGADGATSLVRRRVRGPFSHAQLSLATGVYAHGVSSNEIVIEFERDPSGYIWSFPRTDHLAIGICAQANGDRRRRLEAADLPLGGRASRALAARRWFPTRGPSRRLHRRTSTRSNRPASAGRSWAMRPGLVDPITREGLFFALHSGGLLADALLASGSSPADDLRAGAADRGLPGTRARGSPQARLLPQRLHAPARGGPARESGSQRDHGRPRGGHPAVRHVETTAGRDLRTATGVAAARPRAARAVWRERGRPRTERAGGLESDVDDCRTLDRRVTRTSQRPARQAVHSPA